MGDSLPVQGSTEILEDDDGPEPTLPPSDRYALRKRLGGGSFGAVWKAWDRQANTWVAVKLINQKHAKVAMDEVELLRKARPQCTRHHVLCYLDAYTLQRGATPFVAVVTEFVEGTTLEDVKAPSGAQLAQWTAQLFEALQFLHGLGIVHRDVKPANIMIRPDGSLVLVDLGLGCSPCPTTFWGVVGTPDYMWPPLLEAMDRAHKTGQPVRVTLEVLMAADYYSAAVSIASVALKAREPAIDDLPARKRYDAIMRQPVIVAGRPKLTRFLHFMLQRPNEGAKA